MSDNGYCVLCGDIPNFFEDLQPMNGVCSCKSASTCNCPMICGGMGCSTSKSSAEEASYAKKPIAKKARNAIACLQDSRISFTNHANAKLEDARIGFTLLSPEERDRFNALIYEGDLLEKVEIPCKIGEENEDGECVVKVKNAENLLERGYEVKCIKFVDDEDRDEEEPIYNNFANLQPVRNCQEWQDGDLKYSSFVLL